MNHSKCEKWAKNVRLKWKKKKKNIVKSIYHTSKFLFVWNNYYYWIKNKWLLILMCVSFQQVKIGTLNAWQGKKRSSLIESGFTIIIFSILITILGRKFFISIVQKFASILSFLGPKSIVPSCCGVILWYFYSLVRGDRTEKKSLNITLFLEYCAYTIEYCPHTILYSGQYIMVHNPRVIESCLYWI